MNFYFQIAVIALLLSVIECDQTLQRCVPMDPKVCQEIETNLVNLSVNDDIVEKKVSCGPKGCKPAETEMDPIDIFDDDEEIKNALHGLSLAMIAYQKYMPQIAPIATHGLCSIYHLISHHTYKLPLSSTGSYTFAYYGGRENDLLVFKGSTTIREYFKDALVKRSAWTCENCGMVHRGFKRVFETIIEDLNKLLMLNDRKGKPLIIAGHSLGAALATLTAIHVAERIPERIIEHLYLISSPRVGDEDFKNAFRRKVLAKGVKVDRFYLMDKTNGNQLDPVVKLPPIKAGYIHIVRGKALKYGGSYSKLLGRLALHMPQVILRTLRNLADERGMHFHCGVKIEKW